MINRTNLMEVVFLMSGDPHLNSSGFRYDSDDVGGFFTH